MGINLGDICSKRHLKSITKLLLVRAFSRREIPQADESKEAFVVSLSRKEQKITGMEKVILHIHSEGMTEYEYKVFQSIARQDRSTEIFKLHYYILNELTFNEEAVQYILSTRRTTENGRA